MTSTYYRSLCKQWILDYKHYTMDRSTAKKFETNIQREIIFEENSHVPTQFISLTLAHEPLTVQNSGLGKLTHFKT